MPVICKHCGQKIYVTQAAKGDVYKFTTRPGNYNYWKCWTKRTPVRAHSPDMENAENREYYSRMVDHLERLQANGDVSKAEFDAAIQEFEVVFRPGVTGL